ncbi:MAG: ribosome small subunit-dependent GTPase A [Endozoicomonas sp.]
MTNSLTLPRLGWKPFFQQQLTLEDWEQCRIARIVEHHRSEYLLMTEQGPETLSVAANLPAMTVGDWLLIDHDGRFQRLLDRFSEFSRKAPGTKLDVQMIGANIDTVFVVCSLNQNFNLSRIERYLSLVNEAEAEPVVVLTKADCCDDPGTHVEQVRKLDPMLMVEAVNGLDRESVSALEPWCREGQTIAFMGSSGVGKSTLINTLSGTAEVLTGGVREADSKGRHTTTARSMHLMAAGGLLLDTPGMRELQLADCESGVEATFSDIRELSDQCRFFDCQHQGEPGCAVAEALEDGRLDQRRLDNYQKLMREQALNAASLAERRASDRDLSRLYRSVQSASRQKKKGW